MRLPRFSLAAVVSLSALAACGRTATPAPPHLAAAPIAAKERGPALGPEAIDAALREAWRARGIVPAPRADDATFLRRAYVDLAGTVPPPDVTARFLADASPDKRKKLVDDLLASPAYADHWMNYWDDVLMGRENRGNLVDRVAFRSWLHTRFETNTPWDRIVRDLVAATGRNSAGGPRLKGPALAAQIPMGTTAVASDEDPAELAKVNGAVNWSLRFEQSPQDLAGSASRVFLGVQIQCAQCHDHKTEKWKQDDFRRFANAFFHAKIEPIDTGKPMGAVRRVELVDLPKVAPRFAKNAETGPIARTQATALDGTDLEKGDGTRKALAAWMTSKDNAWFAKAFVNRMWGHLLGRGFYDPVDDIRPSNPATMPELLDRIAADFVAHDFDVKHLLRTICATEAYQLAASKEGDAKGADPENALWARFHLVPLGPEELLNALFRVTNVESAAEKAGIQNLDALRAQLVRQYAFLFDVDETDDVPDYSGTVSQALALLNGALVAQGARAFPGSALAEVLALPGGDAEKVDALTMRVLARKPTEIERAKWVAYVQNATKPAPPTIGSPPPGAKKPSGGGPLDRIANRAAGGDPKRLAYEDLLWAMLNSSEFVFNH